MTYYFYNEIGQYTGYGEYDVQPLNATSEKPTQYMPIRNGSQWIEGMTEEELIELNKPKVPESIARMNLKIQLLLRGIEISDIIEAVDSIPESMFPLIAKKIAIIKFNEAVTFDRYNADLNLVATLMGMSQDTLDEIFINGNII